MDARWDGANWNPPGSPNLPQGVLTDTEKPGRRSNIEVLVQIPYNSAPDESLS